MRFLNEKQARKIVMDTFGHLLAAQDTLDPKHHEDLVPALVALNEAYLAHDVALRFGQNSESVEALIKAYRGRRRK